jgi:hypothetical protein
VIVSHHTSNDGKQSARRAIKSFLGVQGATFQKSPLAAGGKYKGDGNRERSQARRNDSPDKPEAKRNIE